MAEELKASIGAALGTASRLYGRWRNRPATDDPGELQDAMDWERLVALLSRSAVAAAAVGPERWFFARWRDRRRAERILRRWAREIEG